ncbi:hypothetical protein BY996DRAFT_6565353 [Phakopsora pachyrhizi]|nr:hypothetical protein BY996DRAFT_6565353 [Phakopsora pachyrhizi]
MLQRIAELMKHKNRKQLAKEAALMRKEAMGDYSHLKDKKGQFKAAPLPQPTLPKIAEYQETALTHICHLWAFMQAALLEVYLAVPYGNGGGGGQHNYPGGDTGTFYSEQVPVQK